MKYCLVYVLNEPVSPKPGYIVTRYNILGLLFLRIQRRLFRRLLCLALRHPLIHLGLRRRVRRRFRRLRRRRRRHLFVRPGC